MDKRVARGMAVSKLEGKDKDFPRNVSPDMSEKNGTGEPWLCRVCRCMNKTGNKQGGGGFRRGECIARDNNPSMLKGL